MIRQRLNRMKRLKNRIEAGNDETKTIVLEYVYGNFVLVD